MNKAVFLDRDGTINENVGYTSKIEDLEFIEWAVEGMKKFQYAGYKLIIVTNQAGIAKGKYDEEDYFVFRDEMHRRLKDNGITITAEYFCPHHSDGIIERYKVDCGCRKPKSGMLEQAAKDFDLDLKKCWMIGDMPSDIQAGKNAGCKTIQVLTGKDKTESIDADFIVDNLYNASYFMI